jgi:hypothetical protein
MLGVLEVPVYEVAIEAEGCVIQCEILDLFVHQASGSTWSSDWDAQGYRELEFRVVSGFMQTESGETIELGPNGCAEMAERYAEQIEEALWACYEAEQLDS